jgi:hypothetical protein
MSKKYVFNHNGLFTLLISAVGFTMIALELPRNPEVMIFYLILIPFIFMGIFVTLVDIRNISHKQLRYWELIADGLQKEQKKVKRK